MLVEVEVLYGISTKIGPVSVQPFFSSLYDKLGSTHFTWISDRHKSDIYLLIRKKTNVYLAITENYQWTIKMIRCCFLETHLINGMAMKNLFGASPSLDFGVMSFLWQGSFSIGNHSMFYKKSKKTKQKAKTKWKCKHFCQLQTVQIKDQKTSASLQHRVIFTNINRWLTTAEASWQ